MQFCSKCGNELKEGVAFCENCGTATSTSVAEDASSQQEQPIEENEYLSKSGNTVKIMAIVSAVMAAAGLGVFLFLQVILGVVLLILSMLIMAIPINSIRKAYLSSGGEKSGWKKYFSELKKKNTLAKLCGIISLVLTIVVLLSGIAMIAVDVYRASIPERYASMYSEQDGLIFDLGEIKKVKDLADAADAFDSLFRR